MEGDGHQVTIIVDIQNCAPIRSNRGGRRRQIAIIVEASVALSCIAVLESHFSTSSGCPDLTGNIVIGLVTVSSILVIGHGLLPEHYGIGGICIGSPHRVQGNGLRHLAKAESASVHGFGPVRERIAHADRRVRRGRVFAGSYKNRLHIAAALGIKGNPSAGLYLGVEGDVEVFNGDRGNLGCLCLLLRIGYSIPAGDGLFGAHVESDIGINYLIGSAFLGCCHTTLVIHEEHIVDLLEPGGNRYGIGPAGGLGCGLTEVELRFTLIPTHELIARLLRGGGFIDGIVSLDQLGIHYLAIRHKLIGIDFGLGLHDHQVIDLGPGFHLHIVNGEGQVLGGLLREGQELGSALAGERLQLGAVGQDRRAGDGAVHSGQGHIRAGLAGDGDLVDEGVGERLLRTLRGFLLQETGDGVGHVGRLLVGRLGLLGGLLGGGGGHGDVPDFHGVAQGVGDGGRALGYAEDIGSVLGRAALNPANSGGSGVIAAGPAAAGLSSGGQGDGLVDLHADSLGLLFLSLGGLGLRCLCLGRRRLRCLCLGRRRLRCLGLRGRRLRFLGLRGRRLRCLCLGRRRLRCLCLGRRRLRFLSLGFLSLRLHDGRLRHVDVRGRGAEREGVGGAK